MIEINLLKNKGLPTQQQGFEEDFAILDTPQDFDQKDLMIKFLILLSIPLLLFVYERFNLSSLQGDHRKIEDEVRSVKNEAIRFEKEAGKYKDMDKEVKELKDKLGALKELSKYRLSIIRALDDLQGALTERIWVDSLNFSKDRLVINGYAVADEGLTAFESALEAKNNFKNVIVVKNQEIKQGTTILQKFQINSDIKVLE